MGRCCSFSFCLFACVFQSVAQKSERIADEEIKCQHMADLAQNDLNEALPALQEAMLVSLVDKSVQWNPSCNTT